jgi:hypothetical protein
MYNGTVYTTRNVKSGQCLSESDFPEEPKENGKYLFGWSYIEDYTQNFLTPETVINKDLTVNAMMADIPYKVEIINTGGGELKVSGLSNQKAPGETVLLYEDEKYTTTYYLKNLYAQEPDDLVITDKTFIMPECDVVIVAEFGEKISVTFDFNGGVYNDGIPLTSHVTYVIPGESASPPQYQDLIVKDGYTFVGWDREFNNITEPITIKAIWQLDETSETTTSETSVTPEETTTTEASETEPPVTSVTTTTEASQTPAQTTTPPTTTPAQTTNSRIIQNDDASIIFDLSDAILPEGVTGVSMDIEHVKPSESEESGYRLVKKLIDDNATIANLQNLVLYDLKLVDLNGNPITNFEGIIKVKLRIPEGMSGDLRVYWYNTDTQELVDMNAVIEGDYLVFETDHFSYYTIAQIATEDPPSVNPDTGSGMLAVWWLFSAIPLTASIVLGTKTKKKHS